MNTLSSKIAIASLALVFTAMSCTKKADKPAVTKNPNPSIDYPGGTYCNYTSVGTVESCPSDPSIWFINETMPAGPISPVFASTRLLVPVNLPSQYKVNGMTVKFDFKLLPDSVVLNCWFCGTPPLPVGKKIRICKIQQDSNVVIAYKPVIYLYPEKETKVKVELKYQGKLTVTYPDYNAKINGWEVTAQKDGTLENESDKLEYQYLFWEGAPTVPYNFNMNDAFCVKGSETKSFLQNTLPKLGLNAKEYNEMIVFWLPKMMNNSYNLIHFAKESYTQSAPLIITPKPDNIIRVFMAYQPSKHFVKTTAPKIVTPKRTGFTVVEWGGTELSEKINPSEPIF
jgi:hypothetical protein